MSRSDREKGSVLLVVVALLLILTVGAGVLAALTTSGTRAGADQSDSVQAFNYAESGLEWAAWEMRRQIRDEGEDYASACGNLNGHEDADGRYRISVASEDNDVNCRLELVGIMRGVDNIPVQRRLRVTINRQAVEGGAPNVMQDPVNWNNLCASNRTCNDDGSLTFDPAEGRRPVNFTKDQELVANDAFSRSEEVFMFLRFREGEDEFDDFGLTGVPAGNDDRFWSEHSVSEVPEGYTHRLSLGNGFTPQELNDSNLQFELRSNGAGATIEASCIGTRSTCKLGGNNPADQWGEE